MIDTLIMFVIWFCDTGSARHDHQRQRTENGNGKRQRTAAAPGPANICISMALIACKNPRYATCFFFSTFIRTASFSLVQSSRRRPFMSGLILMSVPCAINLLIFLFLDNSHIGDGCTLSDFFFSPRISNATFFFSSRRSSFFFFLVCIIYIFFYKFVKWRVRLNAFFFLKGDRLFFCFLF